MHLGTHLHLCKMLSSYVDILQNTQMWPQIYSYTTVYTRVQKEKSCSNDKIKTLKQFSVYSGSRCNIFFYLNLILAQKSHKLHTANYLKLWVKPCLKATLKNVFFSLNFSAQCFPNQLFIKNVGKKHKQIVKKKIVHWKRANPPPRSL